ncbi:MAG: TRAP transporter small permease subunit [Synergistetes bacterium]|nr:TRAP transporter small permease subunit [Synergistota bacterium]
MGLIVWKFLEKAERAILVIVSITVTVMVMTQVILRYIFKAPIMGTEELATLVGCWLYFIGAAHASRERSHIKADVLNVIVKNPRRMLWIKFSVTLFTLVMTSIFSKWAWNYILWSIKTPEYSPSLRVPVIYAQISLFLSAVLMAFYTLVELIDYTLQLLGKRPMEVAKREEEIG